MSNAWVVSILLAAYTDGLAGLQAELRQMDGGCLTACNLHAVQQLMPNEAQQQDIAHFLQVNAPAN